MEEKLDYTFQIYGNISNEYNHIKQTIFHLDVDKNGYIDQSEIDTMAKVEKLTINNKKANLFLSVCLTNVRRQWK